MKGLSIVLQFVIKKYNGCKAYGTDKNAPENAWIEDTNMQPEDLEAVKQFIMSKEGCSEEKARGIFLNERDNVLNGRSKRPGFLSPKTACLLILAVLIGLGRFAERMGGIKEAPGTLVIGFTALLLCFLVYFLLWNPRQRAYNKVWKKYDHMQEKLEKLCEIENMPFIKLAFKHQLAATLIFLALCSVYICSIVLPAADMSGELEYQSAMAGITVSQDCRGTRYAVYDTAEEKYVLKYLKEELLAQTAEDVCAVIRIEHKERKEKEYKESAFSLTVVAYGYRQYVEISLIDQKTGEVFGPLFVFGEEPEDQVRVRKSSQNGEILKVYGDDPEEDEITEECYSLIEQFESQRNMLDP